MIPWLASRLRRAARDIPAVGRGLSCGGVTAVVGRVETWADVLGDTAAEARADETIVHLQLRAADGRLFGHVPFAPEALTGCADALPPAFDRTAFDEGYALWHQAALNEGAGIWSLRPDAAVETMQELLGPGAAR